MKNSINTYPYDIAAIILAYLRSEIDEKGQQKLDAWLEEADSHKALFARIQDEAMQYEDIQKILSYDAGGAWQIVKQKEQNFPGNEVPSVHSNTPGFHLPTQSDTLPLLESRLYYTLFLSHFPPIVDL